MATLEGCGLARCDDLHVLTGANELRIGDAIRRELEHWFVGGVHRSVGRHQHTERFLGAPQRQARIFDAGLRR